jgi:hypothetical protein
VASGKRTIRASERQESPVDRQTLENVSQSLNSYLGMLRQVNGYKARKALCGRVESPFLQGGRGMHKSQGDVTLTCAGVGTQQTICPGNYS